MGFKATMIIWDFATRLPLHQCTLHKGKVHAVSFNKTEDLLASVGGLDDNTIVVWNVAEGKPLCGTAALPDPTSCLSFYHTAEDKFVTAGPAHIRVWNIDRANRKVNPTDCQLGHLHRLVLSMVASPDDEFLYCGTSTGDVMVLSLRTLLFKQSGPALEKERFEQGITAISLMPDGQVLLCGAGNGKVAMMHLGELGGPQYLTFMGATHVMGGVSSLAIRPTPLPPPPPQVPGQAIPRSPKVIPPVKPTLVSGPGVPAAAAARAGIPRQKEAAIPPQRATLLATPAAQARYTGPTLFECLCGTTESNMYTIVLPTLQTELRATCHCSPIKQIVFPNEFSDLFATCAHGDVRLWNAVTHAELLRVQVPNVTCQCMTFNRQGSEIISGWSDGKIRAFGPETGRLLYVINDAHKSVTALACFHKSDMILSAGSDGQVRAWRLLPDAQVLTATMKEHRGVVTSLRIKKDDTEAVSASADGSCVIWDLSHFKRRNTLLQSTVFKGAVYVPDESQLLTAGTDRKVVYWDVFDASAIRELEVSDAELATIDIDPSGSFFVSAGADKLVKVLRYEEGTLMAQGQGHSGTVTGVAVAPNGGQIVSVGEEGAILLWRPVAPAPAAPPAAPAAAAAPQ